MDSDDKLRLIANRDFLVQNVQADEILDHLVAEQVLSEDDLERISKMDTNKNKVRKILDTLPKKGPYAYGAFKKALQEYQEFIVHKLDDTNLEEAREKRDACRPKLKKPVQAESSVGAHDSDVQIGSSLFLDLAQNASVMKNWRGLARRLDLEESDIEDIRTRERDNLKEQAYQCLKSWYDRKGNDASVHSLEKALRKCNLNAAADSIKGGSRK